MRVGGTQRTVVGVLEFTAVEPVALARLTAADATAAGYPTRGGVAGGPDRRRSALTGSPCGPRARIRAWRCGSGPSLGDDERAAIAARLERMDAARAVDGRRCCASSPSGRAMRAPDLAASLGRETLPFKRDVRKLKELGLTESLEVGYRLSPRGAAYLGA